LKKILIILSETRKRFSNKGIKPGRAFRSSFGSQSRKKPLERLFRRQSLT